MGASGAPAGAATPGPMTGGRRPPWVLPVVIVVILAVIAAGIYVFYPRPAAGPSSSPAVSGGFYGGGVVTVHYTDVSSSGAPRNGSWNCYPSLLAYYPSATAAAQNTACEFGRGSDGAVSGQVPQYLLVPAFAGPSVFGLASWGATATGFPTFEGRAVVTDCAATGTSGTCGNLPPTVYSPAWEAFESEVGHPSGIGSWPAGVLPFPSFDTLLNVGPTYPNVPWGTVVILVWDPNVFPARSTGACTAILSSNLSDPTGNCLSSFAALGAALSTPSSAVLAANGGSAPNSLWVALGSPGTQATVLSGQALSQLSTNFYSWYSVTPGAPSAFPGS